MRIDKNIKPNEPITQIRPHTICTTNQISEEKKYDFSDFPIDIIESEYCVAMFNFRKIASNTIDLVQNQVYEVISKADYRGNAQWWLVESVKNGSRGFVPANYVRLKATMH